jgi:hypothetical protein
MGEHSARLTTPDHPKVMISIQCLQLLALFVTVAQMCPSQGLVLSNRDDDVAFTPTVTRRNKLKIENKAEPVQIAHC